MDDLTYHRLVDVADPLLEPWLELYQRSFALNEQMLVSEHLAELRRTAAGEPVATCYLAVTDGEGRFAGLSLSERAADARGAALWYLAVQPEMRSLGLGARVYAEVVRRYREAGMAGLAYEVERPDLAETPDARRLAERRIAFYQRQGARLLSGVGYRQTVGWQSPLEMAVMVHLFEPMGPDAAFALCAGVLGGDLRPVGPLGLEPGD